MTESVEICRDLKRLAGIVNKRGWTTLNGREAVGGMISLSGPVLIYRYGPIELGLPGYYSRESIEEAVEIMYGTENLPRPENIYICLEADLGDFKRKILKRINFGGNYGTDQPIN